MKVRKTILKITYQTEPPQFVIISMFLITMPKAKHNHVKIYAPAAVKQRLTLVETVKCGQITRATGSE